MISVVCVYNNERILKDALLKSLENQTVEFELITLDNRDGRYSSAAEALNSGGKKANGDYIMFAHQDMWLYSESWLEEAERILESIPDLGVAGVAGMSEKGRTKDERRKGCFDVFDDRVYGQEGSLYVQRPEEVQTLDECLLIVPGSVFGKLEFDAAVFDGWHCYGADYCLSVKQLGLKAYVIPALCCHSCLRQNMKDLLKYQRRLYYKHGKNYRHIYTWMYEVSWLKLKLFSMPKFLGPYYPRIFPTMTMILKRELSGCDTVLDLYCGHHSLIKHWNIPFSVGVELFEPALNESKRKGIHNQYIRADITRMEFKPKSFDAVIAIGVLEHLTKKEGAELLSKIEKWSSKKVIITVPNGYIWQDTCGCNPLQEQRSAWSVDELRNLEFRVRGINGWKGGRGIRYRTSGIYSRTYLWTKISDLTQKITYHYPKMAFLLLATKQMNHGE